MARLGVVGHRRAGTTSGTGACAYPIGIMLNCCHELAQDGGLEGGVSVFSDMPATWSASLQACRTWLQRGRRACRACRTWAQRGRPGLSGMSDMGAAGSAGVVGHVGHGRSGVGRRCRACRTWAQRGRPGLSGMSPMAALPPLVARGVAHFRVLVGAARPDRLLRRRRHEGPLVVQPRAERVVQRPQDSAIGPLRCSCPRTRNSLYQCACLHDKRMVGTNASASSGGCFTASTGLVRGALERRSGSVGCLLVEGPQASHRFFYEVEDGGTGGGAERVPRRARGRERGD